MLAGALTGGGCSRLGVPQLEQAMLTVVLDPRRFQAEDAFAAEVRQYIDFVKSSRTVSPTGEIFMPGEPEERTRAQRASRGLELDETTWKQVVDTAASVGLSQAAINDIVGTH